MFFGLCFVAMGVVALLSVFGYLPSRQDFTVSAQILAVLAAGVFVFAGIGMLLVGFRINQLAAKSAGISLLFFVLGFNWIAFGPGDRNFTRKTSSSLTSTTTRAVSETEGRMVFGIVAGAANLLIIYGFVRARRHKA